MKVSKIKVGAVINIGNYSDIRPEVEVTLGENDTAVEARALALDEIKNIWDTTNNTQLKEATGVPTTGGKLEELVCWASGDKVMYDDAAHKYYNPDGGTYMSGSQFAEQYAYEFPKAMVLPKVANKLGITEQECDDYWQSKADISTTFGTALHKAMEHYGIHKDTLELDGKGTGLHPTLEPIVLDFFNNPEHKDEVAVYEPFVCDLGKGRVGQIDRVVVVDKEKKICMIDDFKTNGDLVKTGSPKTLKAPFSHLPNNNIGKYTLQLNFYKAILEAAGWTVTKLRLHHWTDSWKTIELAKVDIDVKKLDVSSIL